MIVQRFANWAATATTRERAEAATMLAETLVEGQASGQDREAIVATLTWLLDDPAPSVRLAMATVLSDGFDVPRSLLLSLASDVDSVARIIAGRSQLLSDRDLVDLAAAGSPAARIAIAERPLVPLPVSAVIAEIGEAEAALALCRNDGAAIASLSFSRLAQRFSARGDIREALLGRSDLPAETRHGLMIEAADVLAQSDFLTNLLGADQARSLATLACERATSLFCEESSEQQTARFAGHLRASGTITLSLIIRTLVSGNIDLFTALLSELSDLSGKRVVSIVADGRTSSLRALASSCGIPANILPLFSEALEVWRAIARGKSHVRPAAVPAVMLERLGSAYPVGTVSSEVLAQLRRLAAETERDAVREDARRIAA
ncbi:DUF2336 domain-containing protein [Jiella marina]|uniref:DUF2336 domain-containing protein n=1 Tax=Jiella sp. LLJ827 TaxID=2917712 RepID=UPI002100AEA1|nr:DUF2336 domain-containing protein [Jiella sp. LLJ827]MCQ0990101.1 DUF2336 domain-containing protein [Jiella sp. LLJ827]